MMNIINKRPKSKLRLSVVLCIVLCLVGAVFAFKVITAEATGGGSFNTGDNTAGIQSVFGGEGAATVSTSGDTLTVNISKNVQLTEPISITQSDTVTKVIINLNGNTITGVAGTETSRGGGDVIHITGEVDVMVNGGNATTVGTGKLLGGNGCEGDSENQGGSGGNGIVFIKNSAAMTGTETSLPKIIIDKGATVKGGDGGNNNSGGGDVYDGVDSVDNWGSPGNGGEGGYGIGEEYNPDYDTFFEVGVGSGNVSGGNGGSIDCPSIIDAKAADAGDGGRGIYFSEGKKYFDVAQNGSIKGGDGGYCNKSVTTDQYTETSNAGDGGEGVYTACFLDNGDYDTAARSFVIEGSVAGGNGNYGKGRNVASGAGGTGIVIDGQDFDEVIPAAEFVAGSAVKGGDGGDAVWGVGRDGGDAVYIDDFIMIQCSMFIINGTLIGGNGGNSRCGSVTPGGGQWYPFSAASAGHAGDGGNGLDAYNSRNFSGTGAVKGGNGGDGYNNIENNSFDWTAGGGKGIRVEISDYAGGFSGNNINGTAGSFQNIVSNGVTATITPTPSDFTGTVPDSGKALSCNITGLPNDYEGEIYYDWHFKDNVNSRAYGSKGGVEPAIYGVDSILGGNLGSKYTFEDTLLNQQQGVYRTPQSAYGVYCYVILENGITVKSNTLWYDGKMWTLKNGDFVEKPSLAPPSDLKAENASNGRIKLSWTDNCTTPNSANNGIVSHSYSVTKRNSQGNYVNLLNNGNTVPRIYNDGKNFYCYDAEAAMGEQSSYKVSTNYIESGSGGYSTSYTGPSSYAVTIIAGIASETLQPPTNATCSPLRFDKLKVNWSGVSGADGYYIYRAATEDGNFEKIATVTGESNTQYIDEKVGIAESTAYYKIRTFKDNSYSANYSNVATGTLPKIAAPSGLNATADYNSVTLTWNPVAGASYYAVEKCYVGDDSYYWEADVEDGTSWTDNEVTSGEEYSYRISTIGYDSGNVYVYESDYTDTVSATTEFNIDVSGETGDITITWDRIPEAARYKLYRSDDGIDWGTEPLATANQTTSGANSTYKDTTAEAGTVYYYKVEVISSSGATLATSEPAAGRFIASPVCNSVTTKTIDSITVSWSAVAEADGYNFYDGDGELIADNITGTSHKVTGLLPSHEYSYKVKAYVTVDQQKCYSAYSNTVEASTKDLPAPTGVSGTAESYDSVSLSWTESANASGYAVYNSSGTLIRDDIATTSCGIESLTPATEYSFKVKSYITIKGAKYYSADYSNIAAVTTNALTAPSNVEAKSLNENRIKVTWNEVPRCDGYKVYRSETVGTAGTAVTPIGTLAGSNNLSYIDDSSLVTGKTYYYTVKAFLSQKDSAASSEVHAIPGFTPEIGGVADDSISISWNKYPNPPGEEILGYRIYRSTTPDVDDTYTYIATRVLAEGDDALDTISYTDSTAEPGTVYYYKIAPYISNDSKDNEVADVDSFASAGGLAIGKPTCSIESKTTRIVTISWSSVTDAEGYALYKGDGELIADDITGNSYEVTGLTPGHDYSYKVKAYITVDNEKYYGDYSDKIDVSTDLVTGTTGGYGFIKLTWDKMDNASGYEVYWATSGEGTYHKIATLTNANTLTYNHTGLYYGREYFYKIRPYVQSGTTKEYLNYSPVTSAKTTMYRPTIKAYADKSDSLKIKITGLGGADKVYLYRAASSKGTYALIDTADVTGDSMALIDDGLTTGRTYYYKAKSSFDYQNKGNVLYTSYSPVSYAAVKVPTPVVTAGRANCTSIKVSWNEIENINGYQVYRATSKKGKYYRIATVGGSTTSYTVGATFNKSYYYKVRVYKKVGSSTIYSGFSSIKSAKAYMPAPVLTVSKNGIDKIKIDWADVSFATSYRLYRATSSKGTYRLTAILDKDTTEYTDSTVSYGRTYYYKALSVCNQNSKNYYSGYSSLKSASTSFACQITSISGELEKVTLKYRQPADSVQSYVLYRANSIKGPFTKIAEISAEDAAADSGTYVDEDSALTKGRTYYYRYRVKLNFADEDVYTGYSAIKSAKLAVKTPSVSVTYPGPKNIRLIWTSNTLADRAEIYRATSKTGKYTKIATADVSQMGESKYYDNTSVTYNKTYYYKVRELVPLNGKTYYSAFSAVKSGKAYLRTPSVSMGTPDTESIKLNWKEIQNANKYQVYRSTNKYKSYSYRATVDISEYTDTSVSYGKTYYYKVRSVNDVGTKYYSGFSSVKYSKAYLKTPALSVKNEDNRVILKCATISQAEEFAVYRSTKSSSNYTRIATVSGNTLNYEYPITAGKTYYYKVRAYANLNGKTVYSSCSSAKSGRAY